MLMAETAACNSNLKSFTKYFKIIHKIFEASSGFHVKYGKGFHGKGSISVFQVILTSADRIFFSGGRTGHLAMILFHGVLGFS